MNDPEATNETQDSDTGDSSLATRPDSERPENDQADAGEGPSAEDAAKDKADASADASADTAEEASEAPEKDLADEDKDAAASAEETEAAATGDDTGEAAAAKDAEPRAKGESESESEAEASTEAEAASEEQQPAAEEPAAEETAAKTESPEAEAEEGLDDTVIEEAASEQSDEDSGEMASAAARRSEADTIDDLSFEEVAAEASKSSPSLSKTIETRKRSQKTVKKPAAKRSPEDDKVFGALIFVDDLHTGLVGQNLPSMFEEIGGITLLRRTGLAAKGAGLTTLWLVAGPGFQEKARRELSIPGLELKVIEDFEKQTWPERGRVIVLDPRSIHDAEALKRLQKWRGPKVAFLICKLGDGVRVQIEGVKVRDLGQNLVPFDGVTGGAISIPVELLERMMIHGGASSLRELVGDELLGASVLGGSLSREIRSESELQMARQDALERLGLSTDGFLDRLLHRPFSRSLTRAIYKKPWAKPSLITLSAAALSVAGGALVGFAHGFIYPTLPVLLGAIFLWLSLILDRVDGEVARLRLEQSPGGRRLDRFSKLFGLFALLVGLLAWLQWAVLPCVLAGVAALGLTIFMLVSLSQPPRHADQTVMPSLGDRIDGFLLNRNYIYVFIPLITLGVILNTYQKGPEGTNDLAQRIFLALLAVSAVISNICWLSLKVLGTDRSQD